MSNGPWPQCQRTGETAPDGTPLCAHGVPMYQDPKGRYRCRVKLRAKQQRFNMRYRQTEKGQANTREHSRRRRADGRAALTLARQLARGEQIMNYNRHHQGMARLKADQGDPRPPGMTLSLVDFDGPAAYWGFSYQDGKRVPYRLSTDPAAYVWESMAANNARRGQSGVA